MQSTLNNIKDPALRQIAAGLLGTAISQALTGKGQAGASSAISTEKYNHLPHEEQEKLANKIFNAKDQNDIVNIIDDALKKSTELRESDPGKAEDIEQVVLDALSTLTKYDNAGVSFEPNGELGVHQNLINAQVFFQEYNVVKHLPTVFGEAVKLTAVEITAPIEIVNGFLIMGDLVYEIKGNYDKYGNSKEFILDSGVDTVKAGAFKIVGDAISKKYSKVITIVTEAGFITAVNNKLDNKDWNWSD